MSLNAERNLSLEPQLEGKRQEMLFKVSVRPLQALCSLWEGSHGIWLSSDHICSDFIIVKRENQSCCSFCFCCVAISRSLVTMGLFCLLQYEQITQMKSSFETKMQRQHELSEVRVPPTDSPQ